MKELPIACSLSTQSLAGRRSALHDLASQIVERRVSEKSFAARFETSPGILPDLVRFISAERDCCLFLRFEIVAEEDHGPIWLSVAGPPGTGSFVQDMLATSQPPDQQ